MARRAKEPDLSAEQKEHQVTEALEIKRRQLDQEVAQFKAEKEHEYRVFERKLRGKSKENGVQNAPQSHRKRGRSRQKHVAAEAGSMQNEEVNGVQRECEGGKAGQNDQRLECADPSATSRSKSSPGGSPGPPGGPTAASNKQEKEFRGVFTPSYLPLVGKTSANQGSRPKGLLQPAIVNSEDLSPARHNGSAILSSSAETLHPPMTSPPLPPTRPLSSSVPPEKPLHHRSDSSRSDTSIASLRSSLRDPKQPRSPKRVLFSIDDTLVSPSTSPIAQRSKSATFAKPAHFTGAVDGFEKFEVVRNQNGTGPTVKKSESNGLGSLSSNASASRWTASLLTFGRAAEADLSKDSLSAGRTDHFDNVESDDMFTFDEDLSRAGKTKLQNTDPEEEYDDVVEKQSKDPLTASSPHAGSLPIEIKWPGRRESRG